MEDLKYQSLEFSPAMHQLEQILELKAALNASDKQIKPKPTVWFLLPPHVGMSDLTENQQLLQPFPHSTRKWEGRVAWLINFSMFLATVYFSSMILFTGLILVAAYGWIATITYSYLVLFGFYYIFSLNTYPLIYAFVFRINAGSWPSASQVWDSKSCQEETSPRLFENCTRLEKIAIWTVQFLTYTHVGSLIAFLALLITHGRNVDRSFDLERGEKLVDL
ncbi:hypothetical protein GLAREA_07432 [Glarea lozoyensis ATCC 20868]|uniref:Uncharacterized protein n=1 Tax=Glarea lozoyensis (strain ATCC 20868 / MF5171) TaxID=1116229 RepID=S3D5D7_GLAL2|nr:uncharacterized protein GLAREA_07432 [Glarea lozoyensis ATCC 20868]EPE32299.1 hypothetical protein GLAREA_07432 [Glarea lozoyensis ATCC 20868]